MTYAIKSLLQSASNCRLSGDMPYACKEKRMKIVIGSPRQHVLIKKSIYQKIRRLRASMRCLNLMVQLSTYFS